MILIRDNRAGVNSALGPPFAWRYYRAIAQSARLEVQLRQDDLPEVLRPLASACHELQEEEVWTH
jgi:hypothetical protein